MGAHSHTARAAQACAAWRPGPQCARFKRGNAVNHFKTILAASALCAVAACAPNVPVTAQLNGAQEVPPTASTGAGVFNGTLNPSTGALSYTLTYTGLTGPVTAAHLHGPAAVGQNAPVIVPFQPGPSPISGTTTLTGAMTQDLLAGRVYANIHTAQNPGGEIRGQVTH